MLLTGIPRDKRFCGIKTLFEKIWINHCPKSFKSQKDLTRCLKIFSNLKILKFDGPDFLDKDGTLHFEELILYNSQYDDF